MSLPWDDPECRRRNPFFWEDLDTYPDAEFFKSARDALVSGEIKVGDTIADPHGYAVILTKLRKPLSRRTYRGSGFKATAVNVKDGSQDWWWTCFLSGVILYKKGHQQR